MEEDCDPSWELSVMYLCAYAGTEVPSVLLPQLIGDNSCQSCQSLAEENSPIRAYVEKADSVQACLTGTS